MTKITPALHAYLTDWLAWVERGAPDGEPYDRGVGLCSNAPRASAYRDLRDALPDDAYPFGGAGAYIAARHRRTQHLNEARLSWVRRTILTAEITE